jgi:hypothetical protein
MLLHFSGIDCQPDQREKFNRWYDETHIPMLLEFDGLKKVERFQRTGRDLNYPEYLALYEFDSLDMFNRYQQSAQLAAALKETADTWVAKGYERKWRVQYETLKRWERK